MSTPPPHDLTAEQAVLGGMLLAEQAAAAALDLLAPADFYRPAHAVVFETLAGMHARGAPADALTAADELARRGLLEKAGGAGYLHTLVAAVPTVANTGHYAAIVAGKARLRRLAEAAERLARLATTPGADPEAVDDAARDLAAAGAGSPAQPPAGRRARLTWGSQTEPEPVTWAWEDDAADLPAAALATLGVPVPFGRIPAGSLSIAAGREGTGKSSFGIWLAAHITRGTLPGSFCGTPRAVFYIAVEDSWKHTLLPRMIAAGVDRSRIARFDVVVDEDTEMTLSLPADNALLEAEMARHAVALVVVDPLMSVIGENIDTHRERDTRTALDPLAKLADRTGAVILGIAHFSKGAGSDAASLITGSGAFKNVARSIFGFARDGEGNRVMTQVKNSLGRDHHDLPSLAYAITEAAVETGKGTAHVGRFAFDGISQTSVSDALAGTPRGKKAGDAAAWLADYLEDRGGSAPSADVKAAAKDEGITPWLLRTARKSLGVVDIRSGFPAVTSWALPQSCAEPPVVRSHAQSDSPSQPLTTAHDWEPGSNPGSPEPPGTNSHPPPDGYTQLPEAAEWAPCLGCGRPVPAPADPDRFAVCPDCARPSAPLAELVARPGSTPNGKYAKTMET